MPLPLAIKKAYQEITEFVSEHHEALGIDLNIALDDFKRYLDGVTHNLRILSEAISQARQEHTAEAAQLKC